ncbi:MAG: hypothetical protein U1E36_09035 [Rickettsiales bacterium]
MSQWKFSGTIPKLEKGSKERILTALCVLAGAEQAYFVPSDRENDGLGVHHPLREKVSERVGLFNFFSPKINLPGMHGELRFVTDRAEGFDDRHKKATRLLIKILQDLYRDKTELTNLSPEETQSGLTWFYNRMHAEIKAWHSESADHSEQVAILYRHFKNHVSAESGSVFHSYFAKKKQFEFDYNRAALHDVGKFLIPLEVLSFEGDFRDKMPTEQRYREQMNMHAPLGYYVLGAFGEEAAALAGYHHQFHTYTSPRKWKDMHKKDAFLRQAYPFFTSSLTIPVEAKVLQVLDTAEGICHKRGYKGKNENPDVNKRPLRSVAEMLPILAIEARAGVLDPLVVREFLEHRLYTPLLNFRSTTLTHHPDFFKDEPRVGPWDSLTDVQRSYIMKEEPVQFRYGKEMIDAKGIEGVRKFLLGDLELSRLAEEKKADFRQKSWSKRLDFTPAGTQGRA